MRRTARPPIRKRGPTTTQARANGSTMPKLDVKQEPAMATNGRQMTLDLPISSIAVTERSCRFDDTGVIRLRRRVVNNRIFGCEQF